MESKVKYALAAQAVVILAMSSVAAYAAITYPEKVATLIRNAVSEEEPVPEGYGGPFASNLEYDGVVPSMYLEDHEILTNAFDKHVSTAADFDRWKGLVQGDVRVTVSDIPPESPPPTVVGRVAFDGYVRAKNTMPATDGDAIIFWELVPDNGADVHPAVLVIPGSGNQGARDLIGEPSGISRYYYQSQLAVHLARAGYAAYVPELRGYGERAVYTEACDDPSVFGWRSIATTCHEMFLRNQLAKVGIDIGDYRVDDLTRVLRHMTTLGHIDRENIAVAGLSLGGGYSQVISAYNPDVISATVVASGTGSHFHGPPSDQARGNGQFLCCDTNEFTATIAPRPLYVSFGLGERSLFGWEAETGHTAGFLGRVYAMLGAEGNFTYVVHEGRHEYHVPSVIEFLDRHLRPA